MKKLPLLFLFFCVRAFADGPIFRHKDTYVQQEFENSYRDVRTLLTTDGLSRCIDDPTLCVDGVNHRLGVGTASPQGKLSLRADGYTNLFSLGGATTDGIGYLTFVSNVSPNQKLLIGGIEGINFTTGLSTNTVTQFLVSTAAITMNQPFLANSGGTSFSAVTITPTSNQLVLGVTRTLTISATQPVGPSRTYTIPDVGNSANFVMSEGTSTINGQRTFGAAILLPDGAVGSPAEDFSANTGNGRYRIGSNNWAFAAAGAKIWETSSAGAITEAKQPCFLVQSTGTSAGVTGDGTTWIVNYKTSIYDKASNFNTATGVFTAPITGKYLLTATLRLDAVAASETIRFRIVTSARTYRNTIDLSATLGFSDLPISLPVVADMTANDTAQVEIQVSGSTKTTTIDTDQTLNSFSGALLN